MLSYAPNQKLSKCSQQLSNRCHMSSSFRDKLVTSRQESSQQLLAHCYKHPKLTMVAYMSRLLLSHEVRCHSRKCSEMQIFGIICPFHEYNDMQLQNIRKCKPGTPAKQNPREVSKNCKKLQKSGIIQLLMNIIQCKRCEIQQHPSLSRLLG